MKPIVFVCVLSLLLAACHQHENKKISVVGEAKLKIVPDMVELSLRSENVRPAMKDAVAETQNTVNQVLAVCRKYMSDPADIKVSNISTINPTSTATAGNDSMATRLPRYSM